MTTFVPAVLPDSTDSIQKALDGASPGDTVYLPSGSLFLVNPVRSLIMRSGVHLKIDGILQALPGALNKPNAVVNLNGVSNVTISGSGQIVGERSAHAPGNRAGFCIAIIGSSDVIVSDLTMRDAWADGIYVQDSKAIVISGVTCISNARNGMSIISVETMAVTNSVFSLTSSESPMPQAGIDIEPDLPSQSLLDIVITKNRFIQNKGAGVYLAFQPAANRARISVTGNMFDQTYKGGCGPPIGGRETILYKLLYAVCRWIPGYNYWTCPTEFTL
jgi:parallel beta-helix repeat protein